MDAMNIEKIIPLAKGIIKKLFVKRNFDKSTSGTISSRYCYSVWLRHLSMAYESGLKNIPHTIAELGPGDSFGIGLTALLTGASNYYVLDVHKFWNLERNIQIFDELVQLLRNRTPIPDNNEFPRVTPALKDYSFPAHILSDEHLEYTLSEERLQKIRKELTSLENQENNNIIRYFIPWNNNENIENGTVDMIFSQAVLQYVNDLDDTYAHMESWLKVGGLMSHSIDFSSHKITKSWNGHWTFSELEWKLIHGNSKIVLNRIPQSMHLQLNKKYGFDVINKMDYKKENHFKNKNFSKQFRNLSPEDSSIIVSVIQSIKVKSEII